MAERTKSVGDWIRGLVSGRKKPASPDETYPVLGAQAVEAYETLVADAICRTVRTTREQDDSADRPLNAFDRGVLLRQFGDAPAAMAAASGLAMSGLRTAVFLPADRLLECSVPLRAAVEQHLPLVVQATAGPGSGAGIDAAIASGAFVFVARNAQEACDLTLAAHRTAEQSLTPGVVLLDGAEAAWTMAQVALPDTTRVTDLVGEPGSAIECPTRAQRLLFGTHRRRVPRWFDLDNPLAGGVRMTDGDRNAAAAARRQLFAADVARISAEALDTVAAATGRPLSVVRGHGLDEARRVIVGTASALAVAEAVTDRLGRDGGSRGGVLGLTRLSPFPYDEVREALSRAEVITVLERREAPASSTLLLEYVRAAVMGRGTRLLHATYQRPVAAELAALLANMKAGAAARESVQLGVRQLADAPDHPRRQALVQRTRRDCPDLDQVTLEPGEPIDLRPRDSRTVVLRIGRPELPGQPLEALAGALREAVGPHTAGRSDEVEPGVWQLRLTTSAEPFSDPGASLPADVALIAHPRLLLPDPDLVESAALVVAGELDGPELWNALPARSRRMIRRRGLRLYRAADVEELVAMGAKLAGGGSEDLEPIAWQELPEEPADSPPARLPLAVRRLGDSASGPAGVARFWGEFAQPRIEAPESVPQIDPDLALGTMPACTAGFHEQEPGTGSLPWIDPSRCTACGKCWVACPDSAIGAVALSPQALLDAAAELSEPDEPDTAIAGKLKRAHRQLAARWATGIAATDPGAVDWAVLDDAFSWLIDTMKVSSEDRPAFERVFAGTRAWLARLPFGHSTALFHDLESEKKGSGELQMLALDARSCQSCGICVAVCDDEAIRLDAAAEQRRTELHATWDAWEQLPDTSGKLIARASKDSRIGPLAAVLLSRHCLLSLTGGDGAEPGSGERVAVRQVSAVVEYQMQRRRLAQVKRLEELIEQLRERIVQTLSQAVSLEDLGSLDRALDEAPGSRAPLGPVMERLEELGQRTDVDVPLARRLVRTAQELEETIESITRGLSGAGRARFGVVLGGPQTTAWAATFPRNPFGAPVAVDRSGTAVELALGLAHGFLAQSVREARLARRAELLLEAPADLIAQERELDRLAWSDLTADERRACPPILLLAGSRLGELDTVLASDLPVKAVLLDSRDLRSGGADSLLPAIAQGRAFVAGTSPAYADHLFDSVTGALDFGGPALLRIHAPSPARDGFATDSTIERARLAVDCRVNPLVSFNPPEKGGLIQGLSLDGNPALDEAWALDENGEQRTPATWAGGERRFNSETGLDDAVDEGARNWTTLQELAGVAAPVAGRLEERIRGELEASHQTALDALREEYENKLREEEQRQSQTQATKLKERLMRLAGFHKAAGPAPEEEDDS